MSSMTKVLEAHGVNYTEGYYDENFNCTYHTVCRTCGRLPDDTPEAAHLAEALEAAGYGLMAEAWDEGCDFGLSAVYTDANQDNNPYRKFKPHSIE